MLFGPWLKLKFRFASVPPRVPGTRLAIKIGLRPFSSSESICWRVTSFCTVAASVCSVATAAVTSTICVVAPTASVASIASCELGSSLFSVDWYF